MNVEILNQNNSKSTNSSSSCFHTNSSVLWEEKPIVPLIAAPNGECANEKTKDRAKELDYRLHMYL